MAQGAVKKVAKPNPGLNRNKSAPKAKKQTGSVVKPQKAKAKNSADRAQKKFTNGMVARTEVMLGERAGHLELIGKGRNKTGDGETKFKGGTRKFG
ncbi:hypothetical protein QBC35DRAFT_448115 [Podospora australis]|uniref:Uncharacterized protein n=1 Tax=Podospora australis TaxID=1536484 RepID=A0AAN6X0E3_9PEZI|nr:hypothetical protein QBC35DRAFT_448115 [Podospora australis]